MKNRLFKGIVFILLFTSLLTSCGNQKDIDKKIIEYCKVNNEIRFSDITSFDWDVAYLDCFPYANGKEIKEKYGIIGEFSNINSGGLFGIAFCKNGKLVKEPIFDSLYLKFKDSFDSENIIVIYPDETFTVEQKTESDGSQRLYLFPKA